MYAEALFPAASTSDDRPSPINESDSQNDATALFDVCAFCCKENGYCDKELQDAVCRGDIVCAADLLDKYAASPYACRGRALLLAVEHGNFDMLHLLLSPRSFSKSKPNVPHPSKTEALFCACAANRIDLVKLSLQFGADLFAYNGFALFIAISRSDADMVKCLVEHGAAMPGYSLELDLDAQEPRFQHPNYVSKYLSPLNDERLLLADPCIPPAVLEQYVDIEKINLARILGANGNIEILRILMQDMSETSPAAAHFDIIGATDAMEAAVLAQRKEMVQALWKFPHAYDTFLRTSLKQAILNGWAYTAQEDKSQYPLGLSVETLLFRLGAQTNFNDRNCMGDLQVAAALGRLEVVKVLMEYSQKTTILLHQPSVFLEKGSMAIIDSTDLTETTQKEVDDDGLMSTTVVLFALCKRDYAGEQTKSLCEWLLHTLFFDTHDARALKSLEFLIDRAESLLVSPLFVDSLFSISKQRLGNMPQDFAHHISLLLCMYLDFLTDLDVLKDTLDFLQVFVPQDVVFLRALFWSMSRISSHYGNCEIRRLVTILNWMRDKSLLTDEFEYTYKLQCMYTSLCQGRHDARDLFDFAKFLEGQYNVRISLLVNEALHSGHSELVQLFLEQRVQSSSKFIPLAYIVKNDLETVLLDYFKNNAWRNSIEDGIRLRHDEDEIVAACVDQGRVKVLRELLDITFVPDYRLSKLLRKAFQTRRADILKLLTLHGCNLFFLAPTEYSMGDLLFVLNMIDTGVLAGRSAETMSGSTTSTSRSAIRVSSDPSTFLHRLDEQATGKERKRLLHALLSEQIVLYMPTMWEPIAREDILNACVKHAVMKQEFCQALEYVSSHGASKAAFGLAVAAEAARNGRLYALRLIFEEFKRNHAAHLQDLVESALDAAFEAEDVGALSLILSFQGCKTPHRTFFDTNKACFITSSPYVYKKTKDILDFNGRFSSIAWQLLHTPRWNDSPRWIENIHHLGCLNDILEGIRQYLDRLWQSQEDGDVPYLACDLAQSARYLPAFSFFLLRYADFQQLPLGAYKSNNRDGLCLALLEIQSKDVATQFDCLVGSIMGCCFHPENFLTAFDSIVRALEKKGRGVCSDVLEGNGIFLQKLASMQNQFTYTLPDAIVKSILAWLSEKDMSTIFARQKTMDGSEDAKSTEWFFNLVLARRVRFAQQEQACVAQVFETLRQLMTDEEEEASLPLPVLVLGSVTSRECFVTFYDCTIEMAAC